MPIRLSLRLYALPVRPIRIFVLGDARLVHLDAARDAVIVSDLHSPRIAHGGKSPPVALLRVAGDVVSPVLVDGTGIEEVLMQMVDKFQHIALHRPGNSDIVDEAVEGGLLAIGGVYTNAD